MKNLPFPLLITKFATLNKETRSQVFSQYEVLCKERSITVDLSKSTKVIKRIPKQISKRLNYIIVKVRKDSSL